MSSLHLNIARICLLNGGVIAYPTEGVFGLGCLPFDETAVNRILNIKRRPAHKGLILIASELAQITPFLAPLSTTHIETIQKARDYPQTWVVPHNGALPENVTGGRDNVAVRITNHPIAKALCDVIGGPLVSTSANRSGKPALITQLQVRRHLMQDIDALVPGRVQNPGRASQINDLISGQQFRA